MQGKLSYHGAVAAVVSAVQRCLAKDAGTEDGIGPVTLTVEQHAPEAVGSPW